VDRLVRAAVLPQLIEEHGRSEQLHASLVQAYDALEWTRGELAVQRQVEAELRAQLDAAQAAAAAAVAAGADLGEEITTLRGHVRRLVELRAASDEKLASLRARLRTKDETIARLRARLKPQDPTRS
jgi:chromosome segregation ATPase